MAKEGRIGPVMPAAAYSEGGINESTPMEQRVPDRTTEMSDGPKRGANDSFLPARYEKTVIDSTGKSHTVIIEDR